MRHRRFGRTIDLPSTLQLKHQILKDRFDEAQKSRPLDIQSAFAGVSDEPMVRAADCHPSNSGRSDLGDGPAAIIRHHVSARG